MASNELDIFRLTLKHKKRHRYPHLYGLSTLLQCKLIVLGQTLRAIYLLALFQLVAKIKH